MGGNMKYLWLAILTTGLLQGSLYGQTIERIQGEKFAATMPDSAGVGQYYDILRNSGQIGVAQIVTLRAELAIFKIIKSSDLVEVGDRLRYNPNYARQKNYKQSYSALGVLCAAAGSIISYVALRKQNYTLNQHNALKITAGSALTMAGLILIAKGAQQ